MRLWFVISEIPAAWFKDMKWVSHQSDIVADGQAPIGVTDSHKVAILMGEYWKTKLQSKYVISGEKKKKSGVLKRKGKDIKSEFIYLQTIKILDLDASPCFPGFQSRNDVRSCECIWKYKNLEMSLRIWYAEDNNGQLTYSQTGDLCHLGCSYVWEYQGTKGWRSHEGPHSSTPRTNISSTQYLDEWCKEMTAPTVWYSCGYSGFRG